MKKSMVFFVLLAAVLLVPGSAFAEMVQGQVTAVNPEARSLTVERIEEGADAAATPQPIEVSVPQDAELRGIQSLEDVEVGDEIRAEADKPSLGFGSWEAKWIEKTSGEGALFSGEAGEPQGQSQTAGQQSSAAQDAASESGSQQAGSQSSNY